MALGITSTAVLAALLAALLAAGVTFILMQRCLGVQQGRVASLEAQLQASENELAQLKSLYQTLLTEYGAMQEASVKHREQISALQAELNHERRQFQDKLQLLQDSREQMTNQFKVLANDILEDKSRKFTLSNQENIARILGPLQEKIQHFEKRVEETYDREAKERFSLANEIKNLQALNQRISEDAVNLTNALKGDNKAQGTWGEMILESILDKSGLVKGREYDVQVSMKAADGSRSQPDIIVHLPESKDIVIDSKVSLKAYEAFCGEMDQQRKADFLKQHVQSIRNHVRLLSGKDYQNLEGVNSLDFVLMFLPVEASFSVAAQADSQLFMQAFEKNIIIVGPSTLLTTLRTVQNIWRLAQQNRNALEIANRAGALYDKFVAFVADLDDIGTRIDATQKSYDKARNKLSSGRGNLIGRVEKLRHLGARATKRHTDEVLQAAELEIEHEALPEPGSEDANMKADDREARERASESAIDSETDSETDSDSEKERAGN